MSMFNVGDLFRVKDSMECLNSLKYILREDTNFMWELHEKDLRTILTTEGSFIGSYHVDVKYGRLPVLSFSILRKVGNGLFPVPLEFLEPLNFRPFDKIRLLEDYEEFPKGSVGIVQSNCATLPANYFVKIEGSSKMIVLHHSKLSLNVQLILPLKFPVKLQSKLSVT